MKSSIKFPRGSLIVLSGLPGSGKSGLRSSARLLTPAEECWLSMMPIREKLMPVGNGVRNPSLGQVRKDSSLMNEAYWTFVKQVEARVSSGLTTILDGAFLTDERRSRFVQIARKGRVPCLIVILGAGRDECGFGQENHLHRIDPDAIKKMKLKATSKFPHVVIKRDDVLEEV